MEIGMFDLTEALQSVVRQEGSDLHLKVPSRPVVRVHGRLEPLEQYDAVTAEDTKRILHHRLNEKQIAEFEDENEIDFASTATGLARFRANRCCRRRAGSVARRVIR